MDAEGEKWDRCLTKTITQTGFSSSRSRSSVLDVVFSLPVSGSALGFLVSAVFFKVRPWPIFLGAGIGLGIAVGNCRNDLRSMRADRHEPMVRETQTSSSSSSSAALETLAN